MPGVQPSCAGLGVPVVVPPAGMFCGVDARMPGAVAALVCVVVMGPGAPQFVIVPLEGVGLPGVGVLVVDAGIVVWPGVVACDVVPGVVPGVVVIVPGVVAVDVVPVVAPAEPVPGVVPAAPPVVCENAGPPAASVSASSEAAMGKRFMPTLLCCPVCSRSIPVPVSTFVRTRSCHTKMSRKTKKADKSVRLLRNANRQYAPDNECYIVLNCSGVSVVVSALFCG